MILILSKLLVRVTMVTCLIVSGSFADAADYELKQDTGIDYAYVKKSVDFSHYNSVLIDPISVWYPNQSAPTEDNVTKARENLARAQELFRELIRDELDDSHAITDIPGENVLRFHAEFVDLRSIKPGEPVPTYFAKKRFKTGPGRITLVAELIDSDSGDVLARVADMGKRQSSGSSIDIDWESIEADLRNWAKIFGTWFNEIQAQHKTTVE